MVRIFRPGRRHRDETAFSTASSPEDTSLASAKVLVSRLPPPANPTELGLALRTARERAGLSLEQVRDQIEVPLFDLDAIERGALELLHLEQTAVVAIWRYGELLGLDPEVLVAVARSSWPNRALAIDALRATPGTSTPLSHLARARQLLAPIASPNMLVGATSSMGLSQETLQLLAQAIGKSSLGLELGGPARWMTAALNASPGDRIGEDADDQSELLAWEYEAGEHLEATDPPEDQGAQTTSVGAEFSDGVLPDTVDIDRAVLENHDEQLLEASDDPGEPQTGEGHGSDEYRFSD